MKTCLIFERYGTYVKLIVLFSQYKWEFANSNLTEISNDYRQDALRFELGHRSFVSYNLLKHFNNETGNSDLVCPKLALFYAIHWL